MKVCTDACLFGAFTANRLPFTVHRVLDIGTGTGLLSLMLAQKNAHAVIDAIEIDDAAAEQARENFDASPWKEKLHVYNNSIQQIADTINKKYDVIISNPPFYEGDLKSDDAKRNLALHSSELKLQELISIADKLLHKDGSFFMLLPHYRTQEFEMLLREKFFVKEKVLVKQTPKHDYFRCIFWMGKQNAEISESAIIIMNEAHKYTTEFVALLNDYYLYL